MQEVEKLYHFCKNCTDKSWFPKCFVGVSQQFSPFGWYFFHFRGCRCNWAYPSWNQRLAPEYRPGPKRKIVSQPLFFRCEPLVSGREIPIGFNDSIVIVYPAYNRWYTAACCGCFRLFIFRYEKIFSNLTWIGNHVSGRLVNRAVKRESL